MSIIELIIVLYIFKNDFYSKNRKQLKKLNPRVGIQWTRKYTLS